MVIPDTWSILAGPDADDLTGTHCSTVCIAFVILVNSPPFLNGKQKEGGRGQCLSESKEGFLRVVTVAK